MRYVNGIQTGVKKAKTKLVYAITALGLVLGGGGLSLAMVGTAHAATNENGCSFDESVGTWSLLGDCDSTARIGIPGDTTVEGNGFTISPIFSKTSNSNNAALEVAGDNTTINNLTIDGSGGNDLHGINTYVADNVVLNDVTVMNNDHDGIVVNGSNVTVNNITTMNNGWGGIDVDKGGGVTTPAILTVNGHSVQTDTLQIYVDDTTKDVSVVDTIGQYSVSHPNFLPNDELYTLRSPAGKDECKKGGWMSFSVPIFDNQGSCVSWVEHNVLDHGHGH